MIFPARRSTMPRATAWAVKKRPLRLVSSTASQSASVTARAGLRMLVPALLTSTSIRPKASRASPTNRATSAGRVTSPSRARTRPPCARSPSAASSPRSRWRLTMTRSAPKRARPSAMARPRPREAPVTSTTLPPTSSPPGAMLAQARPLPQVPEERPEVGGQRLRLLQRGKVAAGRHHRPAPNVVDAFRPRPRGVEDLAREGGVRGRHLDPGAVGDGPADVAAGVVRPEGRVAGARHPVEHDVGQEHVLGEAPLDVAAAVAPGPKLFHDPGRQADRRVREPVGEGLGPRALNPLVARLLALPVEQGLEIRSVLLRRVRGGRQVAPEPEEGHVDADQAVPPGEAEPGRHERAPVAAMGGEAPVPEHVRNDPRKALG